MQKLRGHNISLGIGIALVLCTLGLSWYEAYDEDPFPTIKPGEGHGSYCRIPERGMYFYGRDLEDHVGSFRQFADWCGQNDGILGWVE